MAAQSEGLQFYRTRSNAIILYNTLPAVCIESVVNIRSGEELYSKLYQPPELSQRIAFKPNLPYGRQDTTTFEAIASVDHLSREHRETSCGRECGAVTSTSELKDCHIQLSNNKMLPARKQSKS